MVERFEFGADELGELLELLDEELVPLAEGVSLVWLLFYCLLGLVCPNYLVVCQHCLALVV